MAHVAFYPQVGKQIASCSDVMLQEYPFFNRSLNNKSTQSYTANPNPNPQSHRLDLRQWEDLKAID